MSNWVCLVIVGVIVLLVGGFIWFNFFRRRNTSTFKKDLPSPVKVINAPSVTTSFPPTVVSPPVGTGVGPYVAPVTYVPVSEPEFIPSGEREETLKDRLDRLYAADVLPVTADGVKIDLLKKNRETPRPRVSLGLSRLAQQGDPIRGDIPIRPYAGVGSVSQYGEESLRAGIHA